MNEASPESSSSASFIRARRSGFGDPHCVPSTTQQCYHLSQQFFTSAFLRCLTVCHNVFEANWKSFYMALPNSSHTWIFASQLPEQLPFWSFSTHLLLQETPGPARPERRLLSAWQPPSPLVLTSGFLGCSPNQHTCISGTFFHTFSMDPIHCFINETPGLVVELHVAYLLSSQILREYSLEKKRTVLQAFDQLKKWLSEETTCSIIVWIIMQMLENHRIVVLILCGIILWFPGVALEPV